MQSPSRRTLLGVLATAPFAGCLSTDSTDTTTAATSTDSPTTTTPTATPSELAVRQPGESFEADDIAVTVSGLAVRHGMVKAGTVHPDPVWTDGAQSLLADVAVEGEADPADINVTATADTLDERPNRYFGFAPDSPKSVQRLGFAIPTDPAPTEASIVWYGPREVRWPLPDALVAKLGRAPDFSVEAFEVPDSAQVGTAISVDLKVANTGARDGRFLAELGDAAISDQPEIEVSVPAGETVTVTESIDTRFTEGEMTVVLRWEGGVQRHTLTEA